MIDPNKIANAWKRYPQHGMAKDNTFIWERISFKNKNLYCASITMSNSGVLLAMTYVYPESTAEPFDVPMDISEEAAQNLVDKKLLELGFKLLNDSHDLLL